MPVGQVHIGKNGPTPCGATQRPCPLEHYPTMEEAVAAYTAQQQSEQQGFLTGVSKRDSAARFAAKLSDEFDKSGNMTEQWSYQVYRTMAKEFSAKFGRELTEEDMHIHARGLVASLRAQEKVDLPETLKALYNGIEGRLRAAQGVQSDLATELPHNWAGHSGEPVGSREVAQELASFIADKGTDLSKTVTAENVPAGFSYVGQGAESIVLRHDQSQTIYKMALWANEGSTETALNALASAEAFPTRPGLKHVDVSVYSFGKTCVIAQSNVPHTPKKVLLGRKDIMWMNLSCHSDIGPDNYGQDDEGNVVCFDTNSAVYDDMDTWRPKNFVIHAE